MQGKNTVANFFALFHTKGHWAFFTQGIKGQRQGLRIHLGLKGTEVLGTAMDDFQIVPFRHCDESNHPCGCHGLAIAFFASDFRCFVSDSEELKSV